MKRGHHSKNHGQEWSVAAALLNGCNTIEQLKDYFSIMGRRFGIFFEIFPYGKKAHEEKDLDSFLNTAIQKMKESGWVIQDDERYSLTEKGQHQAKEMLAELENSGRLLARATQPKTVAKITVIAHFVLAALKLPAALLSGSTGLLNDSFDTLLDGVSSIFVYWGVKKKRENLVSFILLFFMGITGIFSLFEALSRLVSGEIPSPDLLTFAAVVISGLICAFLWFYQKYSGLKNRSFPLITQSTDSRNHVLVAVSVSIGLIVSLMKVPYVDALVGIMISLLILKGATDLLIDLIKSSRGEAMDFEKYGFSLFNKFRAKQLKRWFLFMIEQGKIKTREQLICEAKASMAYQDIEPLRTLGLSDSQFDELIVNTALEALDSEKLISETAGQLSLTEEGFSELKFTRK